MIATKEVSVPQLDIRGKKLKNPQAKKPQRGQKKAKPSKKTSKIEPGDDKNSYKVSQTTEEPDLLNTTLHVALAPKKAKTSRKRKDGYDPTQLAPDVVVPSRQRLDAVSQGPIKADTVVQKPNGLPGVSKREQQINQLKRRYATSLEVDESATAYSIPFVPSDPDFPYELPELRIKLAVPEIYPSEPVVLAVAAGLEVGFARNVERCFELERIGFGFAGRGILGMLTWLDRNLERILSMKKSDTIKIVRPQNHTLAISRSSPTNTSGTQSVDNVRLNGDSKQGSAQDYTYEQLQKAATTRKNELSKLRMIHPSKLEEESFEIELAPSTTIQLQVPKHFPLCPAWLMIVKGDHQNEAAANLVLRENKRGLGRTLNWLGANLHKLENQSTVTESTSRTVDLPKVPRQAEDKRIPEYSEHDGFVLVENHVYSVPTDGEREEHASATDSDYSSGDDYNHIDQIDDDLHNLSIVTNSVQNTNAVNQKSRANLEHTQEKGTAINTTINLTHISLLEPLSLSLNLKCIRCKSTGNHIESVQAGGTSHVQCPACSSQLTVGFRGQALHPANSRIGYLDLIGSSVLDMGPGTFSPTCEKCDVVGAAFKGLVAGQPQTRPCRACHIKQSVAITSASFLGMNSATQSANRGSRDAQNLNLQRGKPLPNNGVCKHYRKSNRWFRFGCCNKVYACDHCHDSLTDHPMELARFQICGWCSKESAIRGLKPCVHCGKDLTRRSRGGYWEGGQGTRDQNKMNRNDPRKYRKKLGASSAK